ncbi:MAG: hypothetical protein HFG82_12855 [Dorea sp.]|jgi:stage III sporulation protein AB|nr:hypothetical protein [Dorea sp.]
MLMKIIGGVLVIAATSMWGHAAAEREKNRYDQLQYLQKLLYLLRSEILYARSYLGEAFLQIGQRAKSPYQEWLLKLCMQMEEKREGAFAGMWEESIYDFLKDSGLPKKELLRLAAFGSQLGSADAEMQVKTLDLYLEELRLSMEELREEMRTKIRLCHCLGVMSGIFITVLLI